MLKFDDGVNVDTSGPWRVICLPDGWYVVGHGCMMAVDSYEDGQNTVSDLESE